MPRQAGDPDLLEIHADMEVRAVPLDRMPVGRIAGGIAQDTGPMPMENAKLKIWVVSGTTNYFFLPTHVIITKA